MDEEHIVYIVTVTGFRSVEPNTSNSLYVNILLEFPMYSIFITAVINFILVTECNAMEGFHYAKPQLAVGPVPKMAKIKCKFNWNE